MHDDRILITPKAAALWTGRPASTVRAWAAKGWITTYGRGRGNVRYDIAELPPARVSESGERLPGNTPERKRAAT